MTSVVAAAYAENAEVENPGIASDHPAAVVSKHAEAVDWTGVNRHFHVQGLAAMDFGSEVLAAVLVHDFEAHRQLGDAGARLELHLNLLHSVLKRQKRECGRV